VSLPHKQYEKHRKHALSTSSRSNRLVRLAYASIPGVRFRESAAVKTLEFLTFSQAHELWGIYYSLLANTQNVFESVTFRYLKK